MRIDSDGIFEFAAMASIALMVTTIVVLMLFIVLSIASSATSAKRRHEYKAEAVRRQIEAHEKRQRKAMTRLENLTKAVRNHGA